MASWLRSIGLVLTAGPSAAPPLRLNDWDTLVVSLVDLPAMLMLLPNHWIDFALAVATLVYGIYAGIGVRNENGTFSPRGIL
jgi:hypothetical protein